jgi:transcriptional regulator with XRE-family HTH domain
MSKFEDEFFSGADFNGIYRDLGQSVSDLRQHSGLTIEQAADRIGMAPEKLQAFETGKRLRSTAPLCYIVEALRGRLAIVPEETPDDPHCQFIEFE